MFSRYLIITVLAITIISGVILLTFAISVHASCSYNIINDFESPLKITTRLLTNAIDTYNPRLATRQKAIICQTIINESKSNDFDPFFIAAVIAAESSFMPQAVSPCEAQGLMQLTAGVIQMMHISDPFDIEENIYGGTKYLKNLRQVFKDTALTLAAYNAGPTRVARLGAIPRISETVNYIGKVQSLYRAMESKFRSSMINSIVYPVCFQLDAAPAGDQPSSTVNADKSTGNQQIPGAVAEYMENKRVLRNIGTEFRYMSIVHRPYSENNLQCS